MAMSRYPNEPLREPVRPFENVVFRLMRETWGGARREGIGG